MVMNNFDKQTMRQWLWDMDRVKAENKRFEELLTKWKDKRIEVLIKENRELRNENKILRIELWMYQSLFKVETEPYWCWILERFTEEDVEKAIKKYLNTNQK